MMSKEQILNTLHDFVDEYGSPFATTCPEEMSVIENALDMYYKNIEMNQFNIGDTIIYHEPNSNYFAPNKITEIRCIKDVGIVYYTDFRMFTKSDIGETIFRTEEDAKLADKEDIFER